MYYNISLLAVQWDKDKGLNGWGINFWNTIRGIKKDLPEVNKEIKKLIEDKTKLFDGINYEQVELLRSDTIQDAEELSNVTDELKDDFASFLETADLSGDILKQYQVHLKKTGKEFTDLSSFTKKAGSALKSLGAALGSMAVNWLIGKAIDLVATGIDHVIHSTEYAEKAFKAATDSAKSFSDAIKDIQKETVDMEKSVDSIIDRYAKLSQGVNSFTNENKSLSTDEYEEFLELNKQLAELFPSLTRNYDENGNAILGLSGSVDSVTESIKTLVEQEKELAKGKIRENLEQYFNGTDEADGARKALEGKKKYLEETNEELNSLTNTYNTLINSDEKITIGRFNKDLVNREERKFINYIKDKFGEDIADAVEDVTHTYIGQGFAGQFADLVVDFSKLELTENQKEQITKSYDTFYGELSAKQKTAMSEFDLQNSEFSNNAILWLEDLNFYKDSDKYVQLAMQNFVRSIDWSNYDAEQLDYDGVKRIIQDSILTPLQVACDSPDTKKKLDETFASLFTLDISDMPLNDALSQIDSYIETIAAALHKNQIEELKASLGFDDYDDMPRRFQNAVSMLTGERNSKEYAELVEIINNLKLDEAELCLQAINDAENVTDAINGIKKALSENDIKDDTVLALSISYTIDQLNTRLKPALDSLSSAWNNIFTDDEFALNSIDILSTCDSIKSKLDELNETEGITVDYSSFEDFVRILSDSESGSEDVKNAFESLAASITQAALSGTEDFETMKAALEDLGVVNNEIVAFDALVRNTEALKEAGLDLAMATDAQILEFVDEMVSAENLTISAENLTQAIAILTYQKRLCELQGINTSNEVANLRTLAENAGYTAETIQYLTELEQIYQQIENGTIDPTRMGEKINRIVQLKSLIEESAAKIDYKPIEKAASKAGSKAGESYADAYMDALKDKLSDLGDVINYISDTIGDQIDVFEDQKDAAVDALEAQKEAAEEALEAEKALVQEKIDAKQAEIDAIEEAAEARKNEINLQKSQYDLERMQNQKTSLVYSEEKGMHYVTDTKEIRDAREAVTEAKENIQISNMQKEMSGLNDIIDSLEKKIEESSKYYDSLIEETEKYWDSLIKCLEDYKARWTELANIEEQAKMEVALRNLGITTDDILNMSDSTFETFKANYLSVLTEMYSGNDEMINMLQELGGISPEALQPLSDTLDSVKGKFDELNNTASDAEVQITKVSDELIGLDGMTSECTVKVNIETVGSVPQFASKIAQNENINPVSKKSQVTGTAHYEGTAELTGNWGTKEGGKTLVGELGQELVVFPNGRFKTVGDNGAEFVYIPKDSVVFNHLQTKELLNKGNLVGRGKALTSGTALANRAANNIITSDGKTLSSLQPGDKMYDLQMRFNAYMDDINQNVDLLATHVTKEHSKQMQEPTNKVTNSSNIINNKNMQPSVNVGGIHITCPGVTSKEVARQVGVEVNQLFSGLHLDALQQSMIK